MKTRVLSVAFTGAFALAALGGTALAASDNHTEAGTPGEKNCAGQTTVYLAQSAQNQDEIELNPGLGNLAAYTSDEILEGFSVKDLKAAVVLHCDSVAP